MTIKEKLVHGVGINDSGYSVTINSVIFGRKKQNWICPIYQSWKSMLGRCYSSNNQARQPTYRGCTVAAEWHSFSAFRAWMVAQDWEGKQLDKDILTPGNKIYGPGTCVLVPRELNTFLNDSGAARGKWPIGVSWDSGKFIAQCRNPFTRKGERLGSFITPDAAHRAWRARKHQRACTYADKQTDPRVASALRARYIEIKEVK